MTSTMREASSPARLIAVPPLRADDPLLDPLLRPDPGRR
eukprot:CAMPEP_0114166530 /NCGR_PEP_ID=MMETSP0043_2-20121206/31886_1 /TAXON_ID=464988 /ORGANISM="Hemiselmis andersenii, Strain CCMP644" /LENGTH=38 /DNA_ID= /DNA_START= /DNA_END= /DNA_ORIENTATION=